VGHGSPLWAAGLVGWGWWPGRRRQTIAQPARVVATATVGPICPVPMIATREMGSFVMLSSRNAGKKCTLPQESVFDALYRKQ